MPKKLRALMPEGRPIAVPGAADALSARLMEAHGYPCVYIGSYATAASRHAMRDVGLLRREDLVAQARTNTSEPQTLRPAEEAAERIRAAVRARRNPDLVIAARSDAFWVHRDLDDCIARLALYAEAGADMVFPTMAGPDEIAAVRRRISKPVMIVDHPSGRHDGAAIVLYYAFAVTRYLAALEADLKAGKLASDTRPLEDFLGYK